MSVKVEESMSEQVANPPPAQPPRRPRVREVSSRFMTPVASHSSSSSSFSPLPSQKQRSVSVQRQRRHLEFELPADNGPISAEPSSSSSSSSSSSANNRSTPQHKLPHNQPQQRTVIKPFKENAGGRNERSHRPDTPMVSASSSLSSSSAKLRATQQRSASAISAAAKLLQSNGMSSSSLSSNQSYDVSDCSESASCCSSDNHNINNENPLVRCSTKSLPDLRPSMSEPDILPTAASSRLLTERNVNKYNGTPLTDLSSKFYVSPCSRSLILQRSKSDNFWSQSLKSADPKPPPAKQNTNSVKMSGGVGVSLPPIPSNGKPTGDFGRKGRKDEDVLTLRLLHNHYLQWRFANAKAEASIQSQTSLTERSLYSLGIKISELYDSVKRKRIELSLLQRMKILSTIVEAQMPYLEEWSDFEPVYSISLSEAVRALLNASFQLPTSGNVRFDVREVAEALNSAMKLMESISFHNQSFIPKAEDTENLMSELARVTGEEKAIIEECGDQLSIAHKLQVEECSLHAQLVQLHRSCQGQL